MRQLLLLLSLTLPLMAKEVTVEQLFNVQTVKVKEQQRAFTQKNFGYVKADESRIFDVVPRFGGYIVTLYADKIYQKVKKGQKLAKIYSPEVLQAKEDYINAINYDKQRANRAMVQSSKEKLLLLGVPESEIRALEKSGKPSYHTYVYAPASGYLFEKSVNNKGSFSTKQKIFTIVSLDKVWVEVKVYQKDLFSYQKLDDFTVHVVGLEKNIKATKEQLYPMVDPKEATATLRLIADNKNGALMPGMYATIEARSKAKSYLTLPTTAVIRKNGQFYVFVVGEFEGEYEPKVVDVEVIDNNTYIIKSGLNEGNEVVNNALFMMDSDAQINGLY
ncbi:MAG: efflux RND transporter periplasmic adaptor subunit [Sulfurimonadaceae bacterium]